MKRSLIYLVMVLGSALWGVSFILTKELFLSEPQITVWILITFRLLLASAVVVPVLLLAGKWERIRKGDLKWFLLLSFTEPFLYNLAETSGVQLVSGSMASIVVATIPLFVPFGMAAAYRERINMATIVGVLLSLVGIGLMLLCDGSEGVDSNPKGLLFLCGAVVIAVLYTLVLVKVVPHYRPVTITTYQNLIGFFYYLPFMLALDGGRLAELSYSPKMLLLLLSLGLFCSTLAYVCYNYGMRSLGASRACIFNNSIPVFSLVAALLIGQESFSWIKAVGMAIVLAGVILAQTTERKKESA